MTGTALPSPFVRERDEMAGATPDDAKSVTVVVVATRNLPRAESVGFKRIVYRGNAYVVARR